MVAGEMPARGVLLETARASSGAGMSTMADCAICGLPLLGLVERHHAHVHNTKWARSTYPLLIDSAWNCVRVHKRCHQEHGSWPTDGTRWGSRECWKREAFLKLHPQAAAELNESRPLGTFLGLRRET